MVASLATASIGAIWVSAATDFGPAGVLERLEQVAPKVLFSVDTVAYVHRLRRIGFLPLTTTRYNGKIHDHLPKLQTLLSGLAEKNLTPAAVVIIPFSSTSRDKPSSWPAESTSWTSFLESGKQNPVGRTPTGEIDFYRTDFDWPLWILFSSGTTGKPKALVHRAGGMLLQAKKEFLICADMVPEDVFFYYTTT